MDNLTQIFISIFLLFAIVLYIWLDYKNNILQLEGFEGQTISSILPPQIFSNYEYIDKSNPEIIKRNVNNYPILQFSVFQSNSYDIDLYQYFRHKIYPCNYISTSSNMETLLQFQNHECAIAFVSEEQVMRYHSRTCRLFNNQWNEIYPTYNMTPNCSAIGVAYYEYMYIITRNNDKKTILNDVIGERIGICNDDMYYFTKLLSMLDIDIANLNIIYSIQTNELINKFRNNELDVIFLVSHPKNRDLLDLSHNQQIKFIKYITNDIHIKLHQYLATGRIVIEDLNHFYRYGNIFSKSAYEAISIRTILMIRNDIIRSSIEYLVKNYISSLIQMRESIDKKNFQRQLNNFDMRDFNYDELVSFNQNIPLNKIANEIYKEEGLIKYENVIECKYE